MEESILYSVVITLETPPVGAAEIIRLAVMSAGVNNENIVEECSDANIVMTAYVPLKKAAEKCVHIVHAMTLKKCAVMVERVKDEEWARKWQEGIEPFVLTENFAVIPMWAEKKNSFTQKELIYIDTVNVFGTGLHETTRFIAGFIDRLKGNIGTFLDIGTGTGILAILAYKCGAQTVYALDNDPNCATVTAQNFSFNNCDAIHFVIQDFAQSRIRRKFDFVAANLITDDLIDNKEKIIKCVADGGNLAVSGVSLLNLERFEKEYSSESLEKVEIVKGEKWAAILYKKVV